MNMTAHEDDLTEDNLIGRKVIGRGRQPLREDNLTGIPPATKKTKLEEELEETQKCCQLCTCNR